MGEDLFKGVGCGMMVLLSEMGLGHGNVCMGMQSTWFGDILSIYHICHNGSIFGKRDLLAIDHIMLALFWSYVPNMK